MEKENLPPRLSWSERELDRILGPAYLWGLVERKPDLPDSAIEENRADTQKGTTDVLKK